MAVDRAVWYPWAGLFLLGTAVVGDGAGGSCSSGGGPVLCTLYLWDNIRQIKFICKREQNACLELYRWYTESYLRVPLETREKDVLYVGFASEDVTLRIVRSCVALGISLCSRCLVCC